MIITPNQAQPRRRNKENRLDGLIEIWVRSPGDVHHPDVPLARENVSGAETTGPHYIVALPPGVKLETRPTIPVGMAFLVYADGTYQKYEGRDPKIMVMGDSLQA